MHYSFAAQNHAITHSPHTAFKQNQNNMAAYTKYCKVYLKNGVFALQ